MIYKNIFNKLSLIYNQKCMTTLIIPISTKKNNSNTSEKQQISASYNNHFLFECIITENSNKNIVMKNNENKLAIKNNENKLAIKNNENKLAIKNNDIIIDNVMNYIKNNNFKKINKPTNKSTSVDLGIYSIYL